MPDRTISVADAKGHRVMADLISEEPPAPALVTSVNIVGRVAEVHFRDHPTCGTFRWSYQRGHRFVLNEKKGRR